MKNYKCKDCKTKTKPNTGRAKGRCKLCYRKYLDKQPHRMAYRSDYYRRRNKDIPFQIKLCNQMIRYWTNRLNKLTK